MRTLAYVLLGIITFYLQAQVIPMVFHTSWLPNLILVWVVLLTLLNGRRTGLFVAIVGGLIHDVLISNFFGLHMFPYVIIVYLLSFVKARIYGEQWYISFILVVLSTIVDGLVRMGMLYMIRADISFLPYMWHMVLPPMLLNGGLGVIIHFMLWKLEEKEQYMW